MILPFKPRFVDKIRNGTKITTIRKDSKNRWEVGKTIHFWCGNPRNSRGENKPFAFGVGKVISIEEVEIYPQMDMVIIAGSVHKGGKLAFLAHKEGFESWADMKEFFPEDFKGKLIHWGYTEFLLDEGD